jgi:hypothetical protein
MSLLQKVLDALAAEGGDVAALLSGEEFQNVDLGALEREAVDAFTSIRTGAEGALSDDDMAQLKTLADAVEAIRAESGVRQAAADARAAELEALAAQVGGNEEDGDGTEGEGGTDVDAPAGDGEGEGTGEGEGAEGRELVTAAGNKPRARVDLAAVKGRARKPAAPPAEPKRGGGMLVAAADVPGFGAGHRFADLNEVGEAAIGRFKSMPNSVSYDGPNIQTGLLRITKDYPEELVASGHHEGDDEIMEYAAREHRLPGGSLVAAGGWCSPSETLYDLCELEGTDGILSIPEMVAARGGVRWSTGPDFSAIYAATGFSQTEAQAIAITPKPCVEIPCEAFQECRLDVIGLCIRAGILQNRAYPESVARYLRGALTGHAHRYSAVTIARMVTGSTAVTVPGGPGATASVLGAIELQATDYRYKHRMPDTATLEVVAPRWLRGVIRSDLAKRNGVDMLSVTDAQITQWFADRKTSVQWVYNWQDALASAVVTDIGGAAPATAWPGTVQVLMYSAGTWVRATSDIITLDAVYDSTLFALNKYNALFSEEGLCVMKRCVDSRVITIPVCPTGQTGNLIAVACPTS